MKKIITMVGTSLIENYIKDNREDKNFINYVDDLKDMDAERYDEEKGRIGYIKNKISSWLEKSDKTNASAEIKSFLKLKGELDDDFTIYLLCSDTVLSKLVGEILRGELNSPELKVVTNLQVKDRRVFIDGMSNLIREIYSIADENWGNVVINITGGYKATIPYLTVLAQVNKCPIYYIFEGTDALIKIPYIPIDINWCIFEENEKFFKELEREEVKEISPGTTYREEIESLIERVDNLIELNPLGITLWEKYKERFDLFYVSECVKRDLEKGDNRYKGLFEEALKRLNREIVNDSNNSDLHHTLKGLNTKPFDCFKTEIRGSQIRILYKTEEKKTRYGSIEIDLYIGSIAIGNEVHNAGGSSEYVEKFKDDLKDESVMDFSSYDTYRIDKRRV